jgi:hypothetical protein
MTEDEKQDLDVWLKERAEQHTARRKIEGGEYDAREMKYGAKHHRVEEKTGMRAYYKSRMACHAECCEQHPKFSCSKCKIPRESLVFSHCNPGNEVGSCRILQPGLSIGGLEGEFMRILISNPSQAYLVHSIIRLTVEQRTRSPKSAWTLSGSKKYDCAPQYHLLRAVTLPCTRR